jgi:hypothetical protein
MHFTFILIERWQPTHQHRRLWPVAKLRPSLSIGWWMKQQKKEARALQRRVWKPSLRSTVHFLHHRMPEKRQNLLQKSLKKSRRLLVPKAAVKAAVKVAKAALTRRSSTLHFKRKQQLKPLSKVPILLHKILLRRKEKQQVQIMKINQ